MVIDEQTLHSNDTLLNDQSVAKLKSYKCAETL